MTTEEKDRLIRALMTVVAQVADCVDEVPDDHGGHIEVIQPQLTLDVFGAAYAVYWMARAMGYRADPNLPHITRDDESTLSLAVGGMKIVRGQR